MRKRKNRFLLFCCSLMPGAGEMYLGFMKMGVSLMSVFVLAFMIAGFSGLGILSAIAAVIWFYSFFHANNLGGLSVEELNSVEDNYLFIDLDDANVFKSSITGKYRKGMAFVLIIIGISMLWDVVCDALYDVLGKELYYRYFREISNMISNHLPRLIIGIVIIWIGLKLIRGKKEELDKLEDKEDTSKPLGIENKDE